MIQVPNPNEIATLIVNGEIFADWESIFVRHAFDEPFYWFRFTCSEGAPPAKNWAAQRIRPGDKCEVYLAGILAVSGRVKTRQVSYSAKHYAVEIQGGGFTFDLTQGSVVNNTGEFKNASWESLPRMVSYAVGAVMPALTPANCIYADAGRVDELVAENKIIHPAFCPREGRALSA